MPSMALHLCYAMSGTHRAYAATRPYSATLPTSLACFRRVPSAVANRCVADHVPMLLISRAPALHFASFIELA
eukprot:3198533-Rhodomonas_salina.1